MNPADFVPLVATTRGGTAQRPTVESLHWGAVVAMRPDGTVAYSAGNPSVPAFARSALKPLFAVGMLRAGLEVTPEQLALACASHSGGPEHLDVVRGLLARYGLDESDLRNTPGIPLGSPEKRAFTRAGLPKDRIHQNCSGKHAAMLATVVVNGWGHAGYLDHDHPVARLVRDAVEELSGAAIDPATITRDGCGAEVYPLPLDALTRGYARLTAGAPGTPERAVAEAMSAHPGLVGGAGRPNTVLMETIPGAIAKDGAEGFFAVALPDGSAAAVKIADGAMRACVPALVPALRALGVGEERLAALESKPVLGWGQPVGQIFRLPAL